MAHAEECCIPAQVLVKKPKIRRHQCQRRCTLRVNVGKPVLRSFRQFNKDADGMINSGPAAVSLASLPCTWQTA